MTPTPPKPLPCPFCGENPKVSDTKVHHWILCENIECELAATAMLPLASEALKAWNTRSSSAELLRLREEVRVMEEALRDYLQCEAYGVHFTAKGALTTVTNLREGQK